jgi:hypothetical protein
MSGLAQPTARNKMALAPLEAYKRFVRENGSLVVNLERLAHWFAWSPDRFHGSEFGYEAFNAAVGLLGLYNESIMAEDDPGAGAQTDWGFALAAVEQVGPLWGRAGCPRCVAQSRQRLRSEGSLLHVLCAAAAGAGRPAARQAAVAHCAPAARALR